MRSVQIRRRVDWSSTHTWLPWTSNSMIQADKLGSRSTVAGIVLIQLVTSCPWSALPTLASQLTNAQAKQQLSIYSAMKMTQPVLAIVSVPSRWQLILRAASSFHPMRQARYTLSQETVLPQAHPLVRTMALAHQPRRVHLPHQPLAVPRLRSAGRLLSF